MCVTCCAPADDHRSACVFLILLLLVSLFLPWPSAACVVDAFWGCYCPGPPWGSNCPMPFLRASVLFLVLPSLQALMGRLMPHLLPLVASGEPLPRALVGKPGLLRCRSWTSSAGGPGPAFLGKLSGEANAPLSYRAYFLGSHCPECGLEPSAPCSSSFIQRAH